MAYKTLIAAVDLTPDCEFVIHRARSLLDPGGRLILLHVVEPVPAAFAGEMLLEQPMLQVEHTDYAQKRMVSLADKLGLSGSDYKVVHGDTRHEVHELAKQINADGIVVGSHGRHGLALILGSTSSSVLHGAPCDVIAVRLPATSS